MKRYRSMEEITDTLILFKDKGNEYYKAGKYATAICHYWFGTQAVKQLLKISRKHDWEVGSPAMNGFYHVEADLEGNLAQAYHKLVLARKVNGKIRGVESWQLDNAIDCASSAMGWPGILDDQRGKAHFRRGVAFMDKAEYLVQFAGKLSKKEMQSDFPNAVRCYEQAALDFYYATRVDFKTKDVEMLQKLYEQCRRKGELKKDPQVHSEMVAGIGRWKGDPRLAQKWQAEFYMVRVLLGLECSLVPILTCLIHRCTCSDEDRPMLNQKLIWRQCTNVQEFGSIMGLAASSTSKWDTNGDSDLLGGLLRRNMIAPLRGCWWIHCSARCVWAVDRAPLGLFR